MNVTTFGKIQRQRLSAVVASQLEEAILRNGFAVGERLPSEQQLADQFGVSRNVVREAFKLLQERGLIAITNGTGAFVARPNAETASQALGRYLRLSEDGASLAGLYETRRILEGANARLAAERADEQDLERLEGCLERMREHVGALDGWAQADLDFHLALAHAAHNPLLRVLLEPLIGQLHVAIAGGYLAPGAAAIGLDAHTRLLRYLKARDPDGAHTVMLEHLRDSQAMVAAAFGSSPDTPAIQERARSGQHVAAASGRGDPKRSRGGTHGRHVRPHTG